MQKELNDKEQNNKDFLEYIAMTMSREMFPKGRPEEIHISGVALNYAFMGAAKSRRRKDCTRTIEEVPALRKRLYWDARSCEKKVVGLLHIGDTTDWVVPENWIIPGEAGREVMIAFPTYKGDLRDKSQGGYAGQAVGYKNLVSFLSSFKGTRRQTLEENNKFCMKCLFLFYPSLLNEFCKDLMNWCCNRVMGEAEYAEVDEILKALSEYLMLLKDLKPLMRKEFFPREIANILNNHRLQVLSYKMEKELRDDQARDIYKKCIEDSVHKGVRNTYSISNLKLEIDQSIRGGKELAQALWNIKKLAESIREMT